MKKLLTLTLTAILCCLLTGLAQAQSVEPMTQTYNSGSGTWTAPAGTWKVTKLEAWGGGGGGGRISNQNRAVGSGGGGGAYQYVENISATPGTTVTYSVGAGGSGGNTVTDGNASTAILGVHNLNAAGGKKGSTATRPNSSGTNTAQGGAGGYTGGDGGSATVTRSNNSTTVSVSGAGGAGQNGGAGGASVTNSYGAGSNGTAPGGGGSGARNSSSNNRNQNGGNGAAGRVTISYEILTLTVTLDLNYTGAPAAETFDVLYYDKYSTNLTTPSRGDGYVFFGWFTAATGGTKVTADSLCTSTSNVTLYAHWGKVLNTNSGNGYDDLQTAIDAATAGDSLVVLADLNLTATIAIDKSLKINGGKHVIKTTSNRGLWFDAGSVTLNLKNFYLDGTNMIESSGIRGIQVDQNDVTLNMDSCRVYNVDEYAFWAFRDKMNLNVTVTNSYIEGMVVLKCYSSNSTFSFVNDTLYGLNPCATDMNYATIFIDGNYEPALGNDNSFSFEKCVIISEAWADCDPLWLGIAFSASGNNVTVDADTKIIDNEDEQNDLTAEMNFWLGGGKNYVTMPLSSVQIDSVEANFYTVTASGSNSVISAPVLWKGTKVTLVQPSFDKMFIDFHIPFDSNLLVAGDVLTLDDNITLKHDATLNINGDLKLNFKNGTTTYTITQGDYHVVLMEGSTVTTDMQNLALFTSPTGRVIETANGNNTYTYSMAKVYNATQNKGYSDLQPAIDAAAAGDSIVVLTDLNLTAYVDVNKSIIINGNNNTITSTATRGFRITQSNLNVTIRNLNEVCPLSPISQDYRGISFDLGLTNVNLLMDSCRFTGSDYAINLTPDNNGHIVTVKNSYIQGWAALNSFAQNTAFTFINDTLYGINKGNCSNNNTSMYYATICLDGGSLLGVTGTSNTTLDIQNSVVIAQENTDCVQRWIDVKYGASICEVSVDGNTKIIDGDENDVTSKIYVYGAKNTVTLPLTAEEKAVLAAKYYTLTDNPDGSTRVSHSIRYTQYLTANTMYIDFHYPFITHTLAANDTIELLEDVTMSQEVYAPFVGNFTIHFKDGSEEHSITQGDYTIVLDDNQTCTTDKQALALFSSIIGSSITETDNNNGTWTYSVTPYNIITYYSNNSAHEEDAQTKPNGETVNLYDYKTFDHADSTIYRWNTQADGNGTDYALGAAYSANADLDLYAVWLLNLNMTMDSTDVVCYGENNGTDTVKIIGGEAPFQIVLSSTVMAENDTVKNLMDRTHIFTNLKPGKYNVQLTDVLKKDTIRGTFTIAQPDTLEITALTVPEDFPCPLMGNGSYDVSVTAQGGNGGYHYTWSEAAVNIDAAATTVVSGADDRDSIYTVKVVVTDSKNCTAEGIKTFTVSKVIADDGTVHSNSKLTIDTIRVGIMSGCDTVYKEYGTPVFTTTIPGGYPEDRLTIVNNIATAYPDSVFYLGENKIIWTATDTCGHSITGEQVIIIFHYPCPNVSDVDGNDYTAVRVGCDCWTAENMRTTKYSDGRAISNLMKYESPTHPDAEANFAIYGYLYDWTAALDAEGGVTPDADGNVQGVCPTGWHMPTDLDFANVAGVQGRHDISDLRSTDYWLDGGGNNSTNFNLLPGGFYNDNTARYENILGEAYLWSVNSADPSQPKVFWADCHCYMWQVGDPSANMGASVRCVKD